MHEFSYNSISDQDKKLNEAITVIDDKARRLGLEHIDTIFEIVSQDRMRELSSYIIPIRYHHWTFGREYYKTRTLDKYGQGGRLYEMVINSNPAYAWLLDQNTLIENKMVVAHVLGHVDFFENNILYKATDKKIISTCAKNAEIIADYAFRYGEEVVERWIDTCLALSWNINLNPIIKKEYNWMKRDNNEEIKKELPELLESMKNFDPIFIAEKVKEMLIARQNNLNPEPIMEVDLLLFFLHEAKNISKWQRDIMAIIHEEQNYFRPNIQTHIVNEGWSCATYETLIQTDKGFIELGKIYDHKLYVKLRNHNNMVSYENPHETSSDKILKLTLQNGMMIRGLLRHKLQIWKDGQEKTKQLCELDMKDKIIVSLGANLWSNENPAVISHTKYSHLARETQIIHLDNDRYQMNLAIARLLGVIIAEGAFAKREIRIANKDLSLLKICQKICIDEFNYEAKITPRKTEDGKYDLNIYSKSIRELLIAFGLKEVKSGEKEIPWSVLQSDKKIVCSFLSGLYEGDGCVSRKQIILVSKSQKLISQTAMLLNNIGIRTSYSRMKKDGYKDCHRLTICGKHHLEIFQSEIGFMSDKKSNHLKKEIDSFIKPQKNWENIELSENSDWISIGIYSIEEDGEEVCYDLTVPDGNVYVGNGILNHNTWWHKKILTELDVEQDFLKENGEDMFYKLLSMHSNVVAPVKRGILHPYFVGYKMWDYMYNNFLNPSEGFKKHHNIDRALTEEETIDRMKMYRSFSTNSSFFRDFLDETLIEDLDLFNFRLIDDEWVVTSNNPTNIKNNLTKMFSNAGMPRILVIDDNYRDQGELYLIQDFDGNIMEDESIRKTLEYIGKIWIKPIHLEVVDRTNDKYTFDAKTGLRKLSHGNEYCKVYTYHGTQDDIEIKDLPIFPRNILDRGKIIIGDTFREIRENKKAIEKKVNNAIF